MQRHCCRASATATNTPWSADYAGSRAITRYRLRAMWLWMPAPPSCVPRLSRKPRGRFNMRAQYFTRDGRPLSEREAHDRHGMIRDGVIVRVPMQMRDSAAVDPRLRFTSACRVTDGQGGVAGLDRAGFRMHADDARTIVRV